MFLVVTIFLLKCILQSLLDLQCILLYNKVIQLYIDIHTLFSVFFSIVAYCRVLSRVPRAIHSRTLLFIHSLCNSLYNSVHLLILNSSPTATHVPFDNHQSVLCVCESFFFLFHRYVHLCGILDSTCK